MRSSPLQPNMDSTARWACVRVRVRVWAKVRVRVRVRVRIRVRVGVGVGVGVRVRVRVSVRRARLVDTGRSERRTNNAISGGVDAWLG